MQNKTLRIGFGRRDLTPEYSVPLGGYGNSHMRMSQGFYSRIYATCVAITDDRDETLLLFTVDQIRSEQRWTDAVRARITAQTGIPAERIMVCGTHTHSGPDIGAALDDSPYFDQYVQALTDAADQALSDRAAAQAYMGRTQVEGLNFVRHYKMTDGSIVGVHFGTREGKEFAGHTMQADKIMQLLRFVRAEKPDVLLLNWQSHPLLGSACSTEPGRSRWLMVGADFVAATRDLVEQQSGCLTAFFQGASGNINPSSWIPEETSPADPVEYGEQLGKIALEALKNMEPVFAGDLQTRRVWYEGQWDHSEDHKLPQAETINDLWCKTNDAALCKQEAEKLGIHSAYHAMFIVKRAHSHGTCRMELNTAALGDVAFVFAPYEMFCNNAQSIKEHSPYAITFVMGHSNATCGYLASKEAFDHGCYEVDNRRFPRGTAEAAENHFHQMLKDMKNQ